MSSKFVRDSVNDFMETEFPEENIIDLTAHFEEIEDLLDHYDLTINDSWVGIQFIGSDEVPVSIQSQNQKGCFKEFGAIYIHVVAVAHFGSHKEIINRAEIIRDKLRGRRINETVLIEQVGPANFGEGVTLNFESGYTAAAIAVYYRRDIDL